MAETIQETVYKKPSLVTKEEIIKELQRVYFEHFENSYMSYAKFRQYSAISDYFIYKHLDSWDNAVSKAGVNSADLTTFYANEIILEIKRVYFEHFENEQIIYKNFKQHSTLPLKKIIKYFGTWKNALNKSGINYAPDLTAIHTNTIIAKIRQVYFEHFENSYMTFVKFRPYSSFYLKKISKYFGTWENALKQAGVYYNPDLTNIYIDEIITEIKRVYFAHYENSKMTLKQFLQHSSISKGKLNKYFKTWNNALKEANVYFYPKLITKDEKRQQILDDLHKINDLKEGVFFNYSTYKDNKGRYDFNEIMNLFNYVKWEEFINQELEIYKKIKYNVISNKIYYAEKELFNEMKRVWEKLGKRPSYNEFKLNATINSSFYIKKYMTWVLCVNKFYLKNKAFIKYEGGRKFVISKDWLLEDIKVVKKIHKKQILRFSDYKLLGGKYSKASFIKYFGSWKNTLHLVGLESANITIIWTESQFLLDELQKIIATLGRNPFSYEIENLGKYPYLHYRKAFGSVKKSLIALAQSRENANG
ncbi:hypothetical protein [Flavobacterium sp.]|uniref:hypothetical protein n=1 Tax=Flavobacterium sp. TaxID=239 RepID=UPI00374FF5AF